MVDLLAGIRAALDELTPVLDRRVVDIEMPRLTVDADGATLQRALVAVIGRAVERSEATITVRATREGTVARIEVMAEHPLVGAPAACGWPATLAADVEAIEGQLGGGDGARLWLTVPLSGPSAPEA